MPELEVKLYLDDLPALAARLERLGAPLIQPRTLEVNLRFDTPDRRLTQTFQTLRLRQDTQVHLTYKGPGKDQSGVRVRPEIEFTAGDFAAAQAFLEALGYEVYLVYEKYRAVYDLGGVHITLDELPYGNFAEIEGPDPASIRAACDELGLEWAARSLSSYTALFDQVRLRLDLHMRDLSFADFAGVQVSAQDLGLRPADV